MGIKGLLTWVVLWMAVNSHSMANQTKVCVNQTIQAIIKTLDKKVSKWNISYTLTWNINFYYEKKNDNNISLTISNKGQYFNYIKCLNDTFTMVANNRNIQWECGTIEAEELKKVLKKLEENEIIPF